MSRTDPLPEVPDEEPIDEGELIDAPDAPSAAQRFGITVAEQRRGEPLALRLAEEEPEAGEAPTVEETDQDAEDAAVRVVGSADELGGATDDPVDHYLEGA
ncbi:MAG: hypothetical protein ACKO8G_02990 [Actinomycetota bacterium]